ncbi:MAG: hypothetical protein ACI9MR_004548 [Myxococcota bacterium]|jgi:hypothetical protein
MFESSLHPHLVVVDGAFASDGGSIWLRVQQPDGTIRGLVLVQHMFLDPAPSDRLPGRLYLDGVLVGLRSAQEQKLLAGMNAADIVEAEPRPGAPSASPTPGLVGSKDIQTFLDKIDAGGSLAHLVSELVAFVSSEEYLSVAREVGQSA